MDWKLHAGKDDEVNTSDGPAYGVVMELVSKLANKGYYLYCDNFYSSPKLFHKLYEMGFGACSTGRPTWTYSRLSVIQVYIRTT